MVNGLQLGQFLSNRPAPVTRLQPNYGEGLAELGKAIAQGQRANAAQDLQRQELEQRNQRDLHAQGLADRTADRQDRRADDYYRLTNRQENRREAQAQFERSKLADAQHEALIHDFYAATTANDPRAIQYAIDALQRAGYPVEQMEHSAETPPMQEQPAPYDDTLGGTLLSDNEAAEAQQGVRDNESAEHAQPMKVPLPGQSPMSAMDKRTLNELDAAGESYLSKLKKKPSAEDAKTSAELDAVEADYLPKLRGTVAPRKRFLPGQDIILGGGDSYNRLGSDYPKVRSPGQVDKTGWAARYGSSDQKGTGFLGMLQRPDGDQSSELSIGVDIDGKQTEIPSLVPTLTTAERDYLLRMKDSDRMPDEIVRKATEFARTRQAQGKSPFADDSESPNALDEAYRRQIGPL